MTDEQARRAIGDVLLRAFAARDDAPPEMRALLAQIEAQPASTPTPKRNRRSRHATDR